MLISSETMIGLLLELLEDTILAESADKSADKTLIARGYQ